jgi:hypothetical protein
MEVKYMTTFTPRRQTLYRISAIHYPSRAMRALSLERLAAHATTVMF